SSRGKPPVIPETSGVTSLADVHASVDPIPCLVNRVAPFARVSVQFALRRTGTNLEAQNAHSVAVYQIVTPVHPLHPLIEGIQRFTGKTGDKKCVGRDVITPG